MKCGLQLAMGASVCGRDALQEVAALAEELDYDSILMGDHIVVPKRIATSWPYDEYVGGRPPYEVYTDMEILDPFDTVAFLAAATQRVRLGVSVLYLLPLSRDTGALLSQMRAFAQKMKETI